MANLAEMSLDELYNRGTELRGELKDLQAKQERSDDDTVALRALCDEAMELDTTITLSELENRKGEERLRSTQGGWINQSGHEVRSIGDLVVDEDMLRWAAKEGRLGRNSGDTFEISYSDKGSGAQMFTRAMQEWGSGGPPTYDGSGAGNLLPVGQPIAPIPRHARLFLRDLIPTMTTTLAQIPYVQELNPTATEQASAVAEGSVKPNASINFVGAKADPTVIAATLVISKQLFADSAAVVQYINGRLPYLVKFKEDAEFLNGSGNWPDIQGLIVNPNVQTTAFATDNATTFGTAFAKVENHDGTPTAVVLNPFNAWQMFTLRAAAGAGTFDAGTPFSALPLTVWGVPTYRTRAMPIDTALVGDFQLGAMIADREEVNVETYRERYAEQNQILLVCEERVGLMNFRPDLFVSVTGLAHNATS